MNQLRDSVTATVTTGTETPPSLESIDILRLLGRGGMGEVWLGKQRRLGRQVAVKFLPPRLARDPHFISRFEQEAKVLAHLNHPNIVQVFDFDHSKDQCWIAMEFVENESGEVVDLRQLLNAGALDPARAQRIAIDILKALKHAHSRDVIHRDMKPSNVLLGPESQIKVVDFGIAATRGELISHDLTATGAAMGTGSYMSPEQQMNAKAIDGRTDLFSVGVLLYEMLTGRLPQGAYAKPSSLIAGLSVQWDELIDRALQPEPENRFKSAAEMLEAIQSVNTSTNESAAQTTEPKLEIDDDLESQAKHHFQRAQDTTRALAERFESVERATFCWVKLSKSHSAPPNVAEKLEESTQLAKAIAIESGDAAFDSQQLGRARECYQYLLEIDPDNATRKERLAELDHQRSESIDRFAKLMIRGNYRLASNEAESALQAFAGDRELEQMLKSAQERDEKVQSSRQTLTELKRSSAWYGVKEVLTDLVAQDTKFDGRDELLAEANAATEAAEQGVAAARKWVQEGESELAYNQAKRVIEIASDCREAQAIADHAMQQLESITASKRNHSRRRQFIIGLTAAVALIASTYWFAPFDLFQRGKHSSSAANTASNTAPNSVQPAPASTTPATTPPAPNSSNPADPSTTSAPPNTTNSSSPVNPTPAGQNQSTVRTPVAKPPAVASPGNAPDPPTKTAASLQEVLSSKDAAQNAKNRADRSRAGLYAEERYRKGCGLLAEGDDAVTKGDYATAITKYAEAGRELLAASFDATKAKNAQQNYTNAARSLGAARSAAISANAEEFSEEDFRRAVTLKNQSETEARKGNYVEALKLLEESRIAFESAEEEAIEARGVENARNEYLAATQTIDPQLLADYGGPRWADAQEKIRSASDARDWKGLTAAYRFATELLPDVLRDAAGSRVQEFQQEGRHGEALTLLWPGLNRNNEAELESFAVSLRKAPDWLADRAWKQAAAVDSPLNAACTWFALGRIGPTAAPQEPDEEVLQQLRSLSQRDPWTASHATVLLARQALRAGEKELARGTLKRLELILDGLSYGGRDRGERNEYTFHEYMARIYASSIAFQLGTPNDLRHADQLGDLAYKHIERLVPSGSFYYDLPALQGMLAYAEADRLDLLLRMPYFVGGRIHLYQLQGSRPYRGFATARGWNMRQHQPGPPNYELIAQARVALAAARAGKSGEKLFDIHYPLALTQAAAIHERDREKAWCRARAYRDLAICDAYQGDDERAMSKIDNNLQNNQEMRAEALVRIGLVQARNGRLKPAIKTLNRLAGDGRAALVAFEIARANDGSDLATAVSWLKALPEDGTQAAASAGLAATLRSK